MEILFYPVTIALILVSLVRANEMSGSTGVRYKMALWTLMAGNVLQILACAYGMLTQYGVGTATIVSLAIAFWLVNDRRTAKQEVSNDYSS